MPRPHSHPVLPALSPHLPRLRLHRDPTPEDARELLWLLVAYPEVTELLLWLLQELDPAPSAN